VGWLKNNKDLRAAQKLHAAVYLERGFIESQHLNKDGRMAVRHDPYQKHADYFAVVEGVGKNQRVIATARQITARPEQGYVSFPTLAKLGIDPSIRQAIESLSPTTCVEISGLAKTKGYSSYATFLLYRSLWQHSLQQKHQVWVMACDAQVYARLKYFFGDALLQIGGKVHYMGSDVVPAILEVDRSLGILQKKTRSLNFARQQLRREMTRFFLDGLPDELKRLGQAPVKQETQLGRIIKEHTTWA
jgi:hypothetical protein